MRSSKEAFSRGLISTSLVGTGTLASSSGWSLSYISLQRRKNSCMEIWSTRFCFLKWSTAGSMYLHHLTLIWWAVSKELIENSLSCLRSSARSLSMLLQLVSLNLPKRISLIVIWVFKTYWPWRPSHHEYESK